MVFCLWKWYFKSTMFQQKFKFLESTIGFGDKMDRFTRRMTDKFTTTREIKTVGNITSHTNTDGVRWLGSEEDFLMVSIMHHDASIDAENGKPDVIHRYNSTKSGAIQIQRPEKKMFVLPYNKQGTYNLEPLTGYGLWAQGTIVKGMKT